MNHPILSNNDNLKLVPNSSSTLKDQSEIDDKGLLDGKNNASSQPIVSPLTADSECKPPIGCCPSQILPVDFKPGPYSVLIGRGKACAEAVGNRRLRVLSTTFLPTYAEATSKNDKTIIVTRLVDMVKDACPRGAFVKLSGGRWWEVDGHTAREKVGYVLRELLHDKYRSSSKSKVEKRRQQRQIKRAELIAAKKKRVGQINAAYLANADETRKVWGMIQSPFENLVAGSSSSSSPSRCFNNRMTMRLPDDTEAPKLLTIHGLKSYVQPTGGPANIISGKQLSADCILNLHAEHFGGGMSCDVSSPHGSYCTSTCHDAQFFRDMDTLSNKHVYESSSSPSLKPRSLVDACNHILNTQKLSDLLVCNQNVLNYDDEDDISKVFE